MHNLPELPVIVTDPEAMQKDGDEWNREPQYQTHRGKTHVNSPRGDLPPQLRENDEFLRFL